MRGETCYTHKIPIQSSPHKGLWPNYHRCAPYLRPAQKLDSLKPFVTLK